MVPRRLGFALTALAVVFATYPVEAGGFGEGRGNWSQHDGNRWGGHEGRHRHRHGGGQPVYGGDGLPSIIPGLGTYAGSISALRVRGNGIYFHIDDMGGDVESPMVPAPVARIIRVGEHKNPCSYESGVCVIRP